MATRTRIASAALLAPLAACIPLLVFALLEPLLLPDLDYGPAGWALVAMFAVPIAYLATWCIGLPAYLVLRRSGRGSTLDLGILALAISLVPSTITWLAGPTGDDRIYPILYICCAVAVASAFGAILHARHEMRAG